MTIGNRIKELRKKNHLTQEKLAEYLNVSCQAVSKWECGISAPDLSVIGPLTRLLHITSDELLGLCGEEEEAYRNKLDEACRHYADNPDHEESYHLAAEAVREYPGEFRYLEWLAAAEYALAYDENEENSGSAEFLQEMMENSMRHYQFIIDNCEEAAIRNKAILGMIVDLNFLGRTDEALWYAEQVYPETPAVTREDAIALCLEGEELLALRSKMVEDARIRLLDAQNRLDALNR